MHVNNATASNQRHSPEPIRFIDRCTGKLQIEKVYGGGALKLMYGNGISAKVAGKTLRSFLCRTALASRVVGWYQNLPLTRSMVPKFVAQYGIDTSEFLEATDAYRSFNDFFIRKLKPSARPIALGEKTAIIPADGRYLFYEDIAAADGFWVKGQKFTLEKLFNGHADVAKYAHGSLVIARLCPTDYHRFHFPTECTPSESALINGWLHSVNPLALKQNIHIFSENKRSICTLQTENFGEVLFIEVGATCVGSIHQTYQPGIRQAKGAEKGYFSFGGSSLLLLFAPGAIRFDRDLLDASRQRIEIRCLMGQSMGTAGA